MLNIEKKFFFDYFKKKRRLNKKDVSNVFFFKLMVEKKIAAAVGIFPRASFSRGPKRKNQEKNPFYFLN